MAIEALPETTSRAIVSSLALNDARSVVKELVDNALDARATAIVVEISANTLDVIQVKDNGTGIDVQDRQLLFRRGCTSKIRTIDDLQALGGTFLGFRGEALASTVELSKAVDVTTRVDGEVAGSTITFAASGMISSSTASHPVGTTIRVLDFLTKIPVRKQTAVKATTKTLEAIKQLLFSYAFARPEVRFSLKVLKGKNDKMNWTYAPTPSRSLLEAASKIAGKEIVSESVAHSISSDDCDRIIGTGWTIDAVVISPSADPAKVRNATQYISIDGRPVNAERTKMKEITKSYKRHVQKRVFSSLNSSISRPFMVMQIRCPPESYDVNVEPAKDEVLFIDRRAHQLLSLVECLFNRVYPQVYSQEQDAQTNCNIISSKDASTQQVEMSSSRTTPVEENPMTRDGDEQEAGFTEDIDSTTISLRNPFIIAAMNARVKPKKMDTHRRDTSSDASESATALDSEVAEAFEEVHRPTTHQVNSSFPPSEESIRPRVSDDSPPTSPRPGPPKRPWAKSATLLEDRRMLLPTSHENRQMISPQQTGLHTWLTPDIGSRRSSDHAATSQEGSASPAESPGAGFGMTSPRYDNAVRGPQMNRIRGVGQKAFKVPSQRKFQRLSSDDLPPTPPPSLHRRHGQALQRGPRENLTGPSSEEDDSVSLDPSQHLPQRGRQVVLPTFRSSEPPESNSELAEIMEFEHRKKAAIAHQRRMALKFPSASVKDLLGGSGQGDSTGPRIADVDDIYSDDDFGAEDYSARFGSDKEMTVKKPHQNPHRNRYRKALKELSHSHPDEEGETVLDALGEGEAREITRITPPQMPGLLPDDPRAYLMRQQRTPSHGKLHRTKSSKLPLETISPGLSTIDLTLAEPIFQELENFKEYFRRISLSDSYLAHGTIANTDYNSIDASTIDHWEHSIHSMIEAGYPTITQEEKERIRNLKIAIVEWD